MTCQHENFEAKVDVGRITDGEDGPVRHYMADVTIKCADCGRPFRFKGMARGLDWDRPMMSFLGEEARLPIEPTDAGAN